MTKYFLKYFFFLLVCFITFSFYTSKPAATFTNSESISAIQILHKMIDSIENIKTLKANLVALERSQNKYLKSVSHFKIVYYPQKKLYFINPEKKLEVLYKEGENNNKALVKHPSLPISIYLEPTGTVMKKNQHYTIHELGFQYIANTVQIALSKEKEKYLNYLHYLGITEKNKKNVTL